MRKQSKTIVIVLVLVASLILPVIRSVPQVHAADVQVNKANFPDANFREFVKLYDTDNDGILQQSELEAVTEIDCNSKEIADLSGIEHFTNLEDLSCSNNQLTSLDVSALSGLTYLICSNNQLTSLDVSACTAIDTLWCSNNQLTSLDVSACADLFSLDCDNNQLTSLDVSALSGLTDLYCSQNQLTFLDVSALSGLLGLYCYGNQLTSLDVSGCAALEELLCFDNQLTSLDISGCAELYEFDCSQNQLTSLDVSACTRLWQLGTCPQTLGNIEAIQNGDRYEIDLSNLPGVHVANIKAVTLANGNPLPTGYSYDKTRGLLTVGVVMEPVELKYVYDTKADRDILDQDPYGHGEEMITSTPDMEVYFTVKLKVIPPTPTVPAETTPTTPTTSTTESDPTPTPSTTEPKPTAPTSEPTVTAKPSEPTTPAVTDPAQQALEVEIPVALNEGNDVDASGGSVVYYQGKSTGAAFRVIGAEVADFVRVEVEETEISSDNYTVEPGSIVKLKQAFLDSLSEGIYRIGIVTSKGTGVKSLEVKVPSPATTTTEAKKPVTPATGETRYTHFWLLAVLLLIAGLLLLLNTSFRRRRESR